MYGWINIPTLELKDFMLPHCRAVTHGKHSIGYLGPPFLGKLTKKERTIKFSQLSMKANYIRHY